MQYESCLSKSRPRSMSRWSWSCPLLRFLKKMVLLPRKRLLQVLFFLMVHTALLCDKQNVLCLQCNTPPTLPWYAAMLMFETHELCSRFTWSTAANLSPSTFQDLRLTHTSHEKNRETLQHSSSRPFSGPRVNFRPFFFRLSPGISSEPS